MRAVILWGGRLVEGKWLRANIEKWRELLAWTAIWDRVASVLVSSRRFDSVVYCWESDSRLPGVRYARSSPAKHFFKTLDFGLEWVEDDETVAVFASDLPFLSHDSIDAIREASTSSCWLGLFYATNSEIQARYPDYNPDKRFASFQEGDIVFSNAFTVRKSAWKAISNIMDDVSSDGKPNMSFLFHIGFRIPPILLLRLFVHSNSKITDAFPLVGRLKKVVSKPSLLHGVLPTVSSAINCGISVTHALPELSIDYDRRSLQPYFESALSAWNV